MEEVYLYRKVDGSNKLVKEPRSKIMREKGYEQLGTFTYKREGNEKKLIEILKQNDRIIIFPQNYTETCKLKVYMCHSLIQHGF